MRNRIVSGLVVLVAGGLVFNWANDRRQSQRLIASLEAGSCDYDWDTDRGRDHVPAPTSAWTRPAAATTLPPAPAGTHRVGNLPADGNLVHSLDTAS